MPCTVGRISLRAIIYLEPDILDICAFTEHITGVKKMHIKFNFYLKYYLMVETSLSGD